MVQNEERVKYHFLDKGEGNMESRKWWWWSMLNGWVLPKTSMILGSFYGIHIKQIMKEYLGHGRNWVFVSSRHGSWYSCDRGTIEPGWEGAADMAVWLPRRLFPRGQVYHRQDFTGWPWDLHYSEEFIIVVDDSKKVYNIRGKETHFRKSRVQRGLLELEIIEETIRTK